MAKRPEVNAVLNGCVSLIVLYCVFRALTGVVIFERVLAKLSCLLGLCTLAGTGVTGAVVAAEQLAVITPADYQQLVRVQSPVLSANSKTLCWIQRKVSTEKDQSIASIWCNQGEAVEKPVTLTNGLQPSKLTFMPRGLTLRWLGTDVDLDSQRTVMLMQPSGSTNTVTAFCGGVFTWSRQRIVEVRATSCVVQSDFSG